MSTRLERHAKQQRSQDTIKGYEEVAANVKAQNGILALVALLAFALIAFLFVKLNSNSANAQTEVIAGAVVLMFLSAGVFFMWDRCPQCRKKYRRVGNPDVRDEFFVFCDSCKTYYREYGGSSVG